ncbi:DNA internalization-related competence protein ComEC/Rec2 [Ferrimonas lipolytica]|uniref:DNA internalization-related competence protein ComEC/Rec2 n=1 Tax=Ferrimonas lipolytica TaxID=2724191 RepID=A0A6H1UAA5_9GAMM|nr:DNA internalization-related competence protein ComEC/Rec2 [Ferrimonas lipolytica]QIZ75987.1 DNA internalization-related competence protein ComEC/Rec2 [Ferrimonas lipolytica]
MMRLNVLLGMCYNVTLYPKSNRILLGWISALATVVVWPALAPLPVLVVGVPALWLLRRFPISFGFAAGLLYGQFWCHHLSGTDHPIPLGKMVVVAKLNSAPNSDELYQRNHWLVESVNDQTLPWYVSKTVELSWHRPPPLQLGQTYRLEVKLKPPSGVVNLGGFNRYRHLLSRHVVASGYVRRGELLRLQAHWRGELLQRLAAATALLPQGDMIRTLVLADDRSVTDERWQQMRKAGLIHLLAISGLHLSIMAGAVFTGLNWIRRYFFADARGHGLALVWLATAMAAIGYGWLAGMELPTLRATVAVVFTLLLLWVRRQARPWELLLRVAALVLLVQPLASMAAGFWLSFGAVSAILLFAWWCPRPTTRLRQLGWFFRLQIVLTLLMCLLQGVWFGTYSFHGVWTNILLLPYFSLLVLPLCLLLSLSYFIGLPSSWLQLADWLLWPIAEVAQFAAELTVGFGFLASSMVWPLCLLALAIAVAFYQLVAQWRLCSGVLLMSALMWWRLPVPQWQLDVIDVGQGLALLITHQQQVLLYDTGAGFPSGFSYAKNAIYPLMQQRGIAQVDTLVISHGDNDHAGGMGWLKEQVPIDLHIGHGGDRCQQGPSQWGQLTLSWFQAEADGNDGSCVLLIESATHRLLLSGDIEKDGEQAWLAATRDSKVDVLIAPHHGSNTSSSAAFVARTAPTHVVFAAGRNNRWGFPKSEVIQRYRQLGSTLWTSGQQGQIQFNFHGSGEILVETYRRNWFPWWYNQQ